jgi:cell division protein FtsI/penicillin-binding protein 2
LLLGFWADHAGVDLQQKTLDDNIGKGIVNLGGCGIPKYAALQSWQNILIASHNTAFVRRGNRMNPRQDAELVQFMAQIMDLDDTFRSTSQDPAPNPKTLSSYFYIGGDVLTFSPLAMSLAYDAFRNAGKVYQPYVVQQISVPDPKADLSKANRTVYVAQPKSQQLFSSATAQHILELLRGVVDAQCLIKFGPEAQGVEFAGKTGTLSVDQRLELQYWTAILSPDSSLNVLLANVKPTGNLEDNLGQILSYQNGNSPASSLAKHIASDVVLRGLERKKQF